MNFTNHSMFPIITSILFTACTLQGIAQVTNTLSITSATHLDSGDSDFSIDANKKNTLRFVQAGAGNISVGKDEKLQGSGAIKGALRIEAGGSFVPGDNGSGNLHLNHSLTLDATAQTVMSINRTTKKHTSVTGVDTLSFGGILKVSNLGWTYSSSGDSYRLFQADTYIGDFASFDFPPLPGSLSWKWDRTTGTLSVIPNPNVEEPVHPILPVLPSASAESSAKKILSRWPDEQIYTDSFVPKQSPRHGLGFALPVVAGDTTWSWSNSNPNELTGVPSGIVFPNTNPEYPVLMESVRVLSGKMVMVPHYKAANGSKSFAST
jgi:hypothetical protein